MPRYIDAEPYEGMQIGKVIDVTIKANKNIGFGDIHGQDFVMVEQIDNIPTADVQEVKHGSWKRYTIDFKKCSNCGEKYFNIYADGFLYCPNCGAYMGGE